MVLRRAEAETADRYGRIVGYAYVERDGDILFVQGEYCGGFRPGRRPRGRRPGLCHGTLGREAAARGAKLGLWADPYYDVLNAETPAMCWRNAANLRWSRAKWCPCATAGPRYT